MFIYDTSPKCIPPKQILLQFVGPKMITYIIGMLRPGHCEQNNVLTWMSMFAIKNLYITGTFIHTLKASKALRS